MSAYRKDSDIGEGELFELADEQPAPDTEGLRWKKRWLARDRTLIFVTYNGPLGSADSEIQAVEELLKALEVRP